MLPFQFNGYYQWKTILMVLELFTPNFLKIIPCKLNGETVKLLYQQLSRLLLIIYVLIVDHSMQVGLKSKAFNVYLQAIILRLVDQHQVGVSFLRIVLFGCHCLAIVILLKVFCQTYIRKKSMYIFFLRFWLGLVSGLSHTNWT